MSSLPVIVLLSGPNLNRLGQREPSVYGTDSLGDHVARARGAAIVINPGSFTHYALAIPDALATFDGPVVELRLSNPNAREPWRHPLVVLPVANGSIVGFGGHGCVMAIDAVGRLLGAVS